MANAPPGGGHGSGNALGQERAGESLIADSHHVMDINRTGTEYLSPYNPESPRNAAAVTVSAGVV